jgi:hypothetical protein
MWPAPAARETIAAAIAFIASAAIDLRLRTGDERGQAIDAATVGRGGLRLSLRLVLRLRSMFAVLARLLIAHKGLALARLLAVVTHIRLLLLRLRREAGLLAEAREILAVVLGVLAHPLVGARVLLLVLRLALPELLLRRRDQAEIVLGVLVVVLGGDRIAGGTGVARELQIFFRDVGCGAADLDVGAVRFEHPGHRVLAAPVIIIVMVIVPVAHPLVVLTVSHVLPFIPALKLDAPK